MHVEVVERHKVIKHRNVDAPLPLENEPIDLIAARPSFPRVLISAPLHHSRLILFQEHVEENVVVVVFY